MRPGPTSTGRGLLALFACVFLIMLADGLLQTILPVTLEETSTASVALIGLLIAVPQGIGFLAALPLTAYADRRGRATVVALNACVAGLAALVIAGLAVRGSLAWWIVAIVAVGMTRGTVWVCTLATVSTTGDPLVMQGANGAVQRGAAAVAALTAGIVISRQSWELAFVAIGVAYLALIPLVGRAHPRPPAPSVPPLPGPRESYRVAISLLGRDSALQASSLIAMCCMTVMIAGNSFFALSLDLEPSRVAVAVVILLVSRDLASIAAGMLVFRRLMARVGLAGTVLVAAVCAGAGMVSLGLAGATPALLVASAVLQGIAISLCIGSTNILAVLATTTTAGGAGLRISITTILPSVAALTVPVLLAGTLDRFGGTALYLVAGATSVAMGVPAYLLARAAGREFAARSLSETPEQVGS